MQRTRLEVASSWDGSPAAPGERVTLELEFDAAELRVTLDAPDHGDPPPPGPAGPTDRLWEHEVVELFLLGSDQRYLELELGPHGHHLVLQLYGPRRVVDGGWILDYTAERRGPRWSGRARVPVAWLPPGLSAANAYAIHGIGPERRYLAATPVPGPAPDFHRLECFQPLSW